MPTEQEKELALRVVRDGDQGAFRSLYDHYTPRLLRFVVRILGNGDLTAAEDVVQETWIRVARALGSFEWRSRFDTWLHGISLNVARERLRKHRDHEPLPRHERTAGSGDPDNRIDLERAISRLSVGRRTVFVLHDLQGYTHREVAELLGVAVGTAKSQLHDARRALELMLTEGR